MDRDRPRYRPPPPSTPAPPRPPPSQPQPPRPSQPEWPQPGSDRPPAASAAPPRQPPGQPPQPPPQPAPQAMPEPLPVLGDNDGVGRDGAAMARRYMPNAIAALVRALDDPDRYVQAAQILLDRGYGKPREYVETNNTNVNVSQGIDAPEIPSREGIDVWLARRRREIAEAAMAAASERVAKGRNGSEGPTTH